MLNWLTQTVTFYKQWQSEKAQRQYYENLSKVWMNRALEFQDEIRNLKAALAACSSSFVIPDIGDGVVRTTKELQEEMMDHWGSGFYFDTLLDTDWMSAQLDDIRNVIVPFIRRHSQRYVPEYRDCDNFAFFMSAATSMWFGVNCVFPIADWKGKHMYNFVVPAEGGLYILEPQTGVMKSYEEFPADSLHTKSGGKVYGF